MVMCGKLMTVSNLSGDMGSKFKRKKDVALTPAKHFLLKGWLHFRIAYLMKL